MDAYTNVSFLKGKAIVCNGEFIDNEVNRYKTEALSNEDGLDGAI
ncbi:hypothetical protein [Sporosarcina luteola]|nr:hypothetical protein [Sporosarcina luteola]